MNATLTFGTKRSFRAKQVINDFFAYVRKPLYMAEDATMSKTEKFQYLFKVLLCKLALLPILIPIIHFTKQLTGAKAVGFGLMHLTNYTGISNYLFAVPLVSSQIVSGYVLGFVRMKFGFGYSVALHAAWNFVAGFGLLMGLVAKFF